MGRKPSLLFVKSCGDQQLEVVAWVEVENTDDVGVWNWGDDVDFDIRWSRSFWRLHMLNGEAPCSSPAKNTKRRKLAMVDSAIYFFCKLRRQSRASRGEKIWGGEIAPHRVLIPTWGAWQILEEDDLQLPLACFTPYWLFSRKEVCLYQRLMNITSYT